MLQNAKKLRNATDEDMKKICITHDLSKRAREKNEQLREELNRRKRSRGRGSHDKEWQSSQKIRSCSSRTKP